MPAYLSRQRVIASACFALALCIQPVSGAWPQSTADAQAHADRGLQLAQSGNLAGAETELRRAVEMAPNDSRYLTDLATILAMQKKLEESASFFSKALKIEPNDLTARRYLAASLWQLHRPEEARRNLEIILKAQPDDRSSVLLLGMVSEDLKDYATAARMLASVPDQVHQRPESIAALARSYYHLGETAKARETLNTLLDHPAGPQGVFLGARIAAEMRDFETAEKLFGAIGSTYPDRAALGYNLALAQYNAQHFGAAQQTLMDLVDARDSSGGADHTGDIYNLLGWCYQKQDRTDDAVHAFEQAIREAPSQEQNYLDLGKVLLNAGRFPAALETTKRTVAAYPESYRAYLLKGQTEYRLSQFTDAMASYSRAAQLDSSDLQANLGLAMAQAAAGLTDAARKTFEEGIQRFPREAEHHLEYALFLLELGEAGNDAAKVQAEAQLKMALALDRGLSEADYQLGSLALAKGQWNEALAYLEAAGKLDPGKSKTHFALARVYRRLGRKEDSSREMALFEKFKNLEEQHAAAPSPAGMRHD
ncbi:MAG TPA: tetratricopeptide repeat protein [Terriglobia bacterium]|nr:tetratricopeptide repeat protein [Terriglobia bacterium]